jgi:hypothetical protein
VAEQPPQDDEDEDGAEAPSAKFLGSVTRGDAAQQLAHSDSASKKVQRLLLQGSYRARVAAPNESAKSSDLPLLADVDPSGFDDTTTIGADRADLLKACSHGA